jgi:hypothetical protein
MYPLMRDKIRDGRDTNRDAVKFTSGKATVAALLDRTAQSYHMAHKKPLRLIAESHASGKGV